ncbi:enoyl-CoA hydratase/isomerase family protein [Gordonia tangerina]|uniref:Enoyl-CoA hydratase-related protein n=1 Tax=Gordonia tangerina TaxID=2911060 RepID=A0ABS9DKQ3_9ACTN|nr:enoyl-CoA hydratase-related protein [Gordonia tangerina]MCF3939673.1 enoyl-CoA hydratase-related protein [Gordonia tangerina]
MIDWTVMDQTDVLESAGHEGVLRLTLSRPQSLNAFDDRLQSDLLAAIRRAASDPDVRSVIVTGRGRAFSSGADIALEGVTEETRLAPRTERELRQFYNPTIRALREMPKPVVAAVNGPAVGLGCSIALACDHVIAARSSSFSLAFSRVGLTLDAGASLLVGARIGLTRATQMALFAETVDAETALLWGMVDTVVDDDLLTDHVERIATQLSNGPTAAYAATKASLNTALLPHLDAAFEAEIVGQTALVDGPDFRRAVKRFQRPASKSSSV